MMMGDGKSGNEDDKSDNGDENEVGDEKPSEILRATSVARIVRPERPEEKGQRPLPR